MNTKIRWTDEEFKAVGPRYASSRGTGMGKRDALIEAQQILSESRRRNFKTAGASTDAIKRLEKMGFRIMPPTLTAKPLEAVNTPEAASVDRSLVGSMRVVASTIAEEIAAKVFEEIKDRLTTLATEFVRQEARARPKVLVVGPIATQQNVLRSELGDLLDLRFVASNEPPRRVGEIAPSCQRIVIWTNFINHQHQEQARATRVPVAFVTGGIETLRQKLTEFAVQNG